MSGECVTLFAGKHETDDRPVSTYGNRKSIK